MSTPSSSPGTPSTVGLDEVYDDAYLRAHPEDDRRPLPDRVLAALGPALRAAAGPLLDVLVRAAVVPLAAAERVLALPQPTATAPLPLPPLADLATSPYPARVGQVVGVQVPAGLDEAAARAWVRGRQVSTRGTPAALRAAAASVLTGTRRVDLVERDGSPGRARLLTYAAETPDAAAVLPAIGADKPLGLVLVHEVRAGQSLGQLAATGRTLGDLRSRTYAQLASEVPA